MMAFSPFSSILSVSIGQTSTQTPQPVHFILSIAVIIVSSHCLELPVCGYFSYQFASIHEESIVINALRAMISTPHLIIKLAEALDWNLLRPNTSLIIGPVLMSDCKVQLAFKKDLPYTQQNHDNDKHYNHNNDDKCSGGHNPCFYHR